MASESILVRAQINETEKYPFYSLENLFSSNSNSGILQGEEVGVEFETLQRWERVMNEYQEVEEEMKQYLLEAREIKEQTC